MIAKNVYYYYYYYYYCECLPEMLLIIEMKVLNEKIWQSTSFYCLIYLFDGLSGLCIFWENSELKRKRFCFVLGNLKSFFAVFIAFNCF